MSERDIDAEFDAIVARWDDDEVQPPHPPNLPKPRTVQDITTAYAALSRPQTPSPEAVDEVDPVDEVGPADKAETGARAQGDVTPDAEPVETTDAKDAAPFTATGGPEPDAAPQAWREGPSIDAEDDDHFEPAPVQLPPSEDLGYWGAIVGLVGGPLLMVWVALTSPFYRGWWILGAIVLFLGGFGLLVMRSPRLRDPDDDDGARV